MRQTVRHISVSRTVCTSEKLRCTKGFSLRRSCRRRRLMRCAVEKTYKYQGFRRIRASAHHLIRQPFGLSPSPQGEGFGCCKQFDKFLFDGFDSVSMGVFGGNSTLGEIIRFLLPFLSPLSPCSDVGRGFAGDRRRSGRWEYSLSLHRGIPDRASGCPNALEVPCRSPQR